MLSSTCICSINGTQKIRINGQLYSWVKNCHYKLSGNFSIKHLTRTHSPNLRVELCLWVCVCPGFALSFYASVYFDSFFSLCGLTSSNYTDDIKYNLIKISKKLYAYYVPGTTLKCGFGECLILIITAKNRNIGPFLKMKSPRII